MVCGVELSTRFQGKTVHLLGYFPNQPPSSRFREWLKGMQESRRDRNRRLVERLQALGIDITLDEVIAKGRSMAGRPHFARILVEKGYVPTMQRAFDEYLDESAKGYVVREEADFAESVALIRDSGGIASVAHPIRLLKKASASVSDTLAAMHEATKLPALEAFHSDHSAADVREYETVARKYGMAVTGGSDYHGVNKPNIQLGTGANGNLCVSRDVLVKLRELAA